MSEKQSLREMINGQTKQVDEMRRTRLVESVAPEPVVAAAPIEKKCPFCAETVKMEAIRCKHCQASLEGAETIPVAASTQSAGAGSMMAYDAAKKSNGVAYLLWFFLGYFGAHRLYIGRESGFGLLALMGGGIVLTIAGTPIGIFMCGAAIVWTLVDLFLIPGMIRDTNLDLGKKLTAR